LTLAILGVLTSTAHAHDGALKSRPQLLIGLDDDRQDNAALQAGAAANQSLNRTDILIGGSGNDVMFGLNGNDVMDGGPGRDIILGGPDGGTPPGGPPNSDIMFGGHGNDVNLWAPGDGSEAFIGGPGLRDALVFGSTDRQITADPETGFLLPTLLLGIPGFPQGIPTANVSGVTSFCTIEASPLPEYEFLVRFLGVAGNLIVTVRVSEVEQVFCSGQGGGAITFADLTVPYPSFVVVSHQEVVQLNGLVGRMIR
jgi:Ca2+-binding RTX toxin-like protein